jgi:hypothetical protein
MIASLLFSMSDIYCHLFPNEWWCMSHGTSPSHGQRDEDAQPAGGGAANSPGVPWENPPADDWDQDTALDALVAAIEAGQAEIPPDDEEDWGDPDCSCPREYIGMPLREVLAGIDAREPEQARPEAAEAGFLPRDVRAAHPSPGPAGGFASGGPLDIAPPEPVVAAFAEEVTGPDGRCAGACDDELIGVLRAWQAQESRAAARKLAVIAELIRRRPAPGCEPPAPGGMPRVWGKFCADELAAATACSGQAAGKTLTLAYDLATRLPGTARALHDGTIDACKARIIAEATRVLDDAGAAAAEALVLPGVAGKTPGQIRAATARAVIRVNPEAARERRERAEKDARVELWREDAGTAALCGRDLPPAEVLAADQRITAYALELKAAGLEATMDQLRARAFLDFVLGTTSLPRPASPGTDGPRPASPGTDGETSTDGPRPAGPRADRAPSPQRGSPSPDGHCDDTPNPRGPGREPRSGPGTGPADGQGSSDGIPAPSHRTASQDCFPVPPGPADIAARINLTIPLATLLGLADRPGEAHGFGAIDPDLARALAEAAASHPRTTWCVTVTDQHGHPAAHGCARPTRRTRPGTAGTPGETGTGNRDGPAFTFQSGNGPPGKDRHGTWRLRTPGPHGRDLTVDVGPLAVTGCDHRHESAGYQPSDRLRHLIEIRDGECTWPPCRRAARACDFEHAIPYDQGGRTCACNAGARCRHHHHAKQAPGWRLDQHLPGYHTWTTPSGRTYNTGPTQYPI